MLAPKTLNALILSLAFGASGAFAASTIVDPDDYADGTDLSNVVSGVSLSTGAGNPVESVRGCSGASTGDGVFGNSDNNCATWYGMADAAQSDPYNSNSHSDDEYVMEAAFSPAASQVSIDVIPDDNNDPFTAAIYDGAGNLLDVQAFPGSNESGQTTTISFTRSGADIALLVVGGVDGDTVDIDNLVFSADPVEVPVMGGFGLGIMASVLGLLGLFGMRRKV